MHYRGYGWRWDGTAWVDPSYNGPGHWYTVAEVARAIEVQPATVRLWARRGKLACERTPGGRLRFAAADVVRWLSKQRAV